MSNVIFLKCVNERNKLRIKILNPGYYNFANCQFPRDLREEGRFYAVSAEFVKLISTRNKYYYCVKNKANINTINENDIPIFETPKLKVYEDVEQEECLLCCSAPKQTVFAPCGHFYTCDDCAKQCARCPICRMPVVHYINKSNLD